MTFNLLASPDVFLRAGRIAETVGTYLPDAVGFQEATAAHYMTAIRYLTENYGYKRANGIMSHGAGINYTPILYRPDKLTLLESGGKLFDSRWKFTRTKSYNYAVLTEKVSGRIFAVINSHFSLVRRKYDLRLMGYPANTDRDALEDRWQSGNVRELKELCRTLLNKYKKMPMFFTGDFNFTRDSAAHGKMSGFCADAETEAESRMENVASFRKKIGGQSAAGKPIDHIFILKNTAGAVSHVVDTVLSRYASDHSAVIADVTLK